MENTHEDNNLIGKQEKDTEDTDFEQYYLYEDKNDNLYTE